MQTIPKSRTVKPKKSEPVVAEQTEAKKKRPAYLQTLSDLAAGDTFHYIDEYWPDSLKNFPVDRGMNLCDKYYPRAVGGPLFVDEEMKIEHRDFKLKAEVMKKLNLRYLVIKKNTTENDILEFIA